MLVSKVFTNTKLIFLPFSTSNWHLKLQFQDFRTSTHNSKLSINLKHFQPQECLISFCKLIQITLLPLSSYTKLPLLTKITVLPTQNEYRNFLYISPLTLTLPIHFQLHFPWSTCPIILLLATKGHIKQRKQINRPLTCEEITK